MISSASGGEIRWTNGLVCSTSTNVERRRVTLLLLLAIFEVDKRARQATQARDQDAPALACLATLLAQADPAIFAALEDRVLEAERNRALVAPSRAFLAGNPSTT